MKSSGRGARISSVEVQGVLKNGVWLLVQGREYFLPFILYPWFKKAGRSAVQRVKLLHGRHLYWPALDVDVEVESLKHPNRYPLMYR